MQEEKIDLVLCKSISRFARNTVDCLEYVRQLKELGIGVIFEKENINTLTMTSEFMITLYGSFAQAESESISKNVTWGMEKRFREGKVVYNYKRLLGYKKGADGKPEIIPEEANVVREIFRMFLDGLSIENIAKQLDSNNVPTKLGNEKWSRTGLQSILRNEKHVGDALLQKTYTIDCISHKAVKNNGERPKYLVSNAHEPIIDRDTFNRVQQELASRGSKRKKSDKAKTEQGKYSSKYALSEILICGECGSAYKRVTWRSAGEKMIVWRCINRLDHGSRFCHKSPSIHEDRLHDAIVKAINEYYDCSDNIRELIVENIQTVMTSSNSRELYHAEQRLLDIDKARNDFISLIATGELEEDSLDQEFQKLYDEEQELNEKIRVLKTQNEKEKNDIHRQKEISDVLDNSSCTITDYDDIIVRKLIECVKVMNKTEIKVIFKDGHEVDEEVEKK